MIPPPNVTGSLHMGHALTFTLQDIADPLAPHAGPRRAVAARHRPRRHRHADGGRAPAGGAGQSSRQRRSAARRSSSGSGSGRRSPAARSRASCAGSAPRWTGRASASPWTTGSRRAVRKVFVELYQAGPDLSRQAAGQLGPQAADRDLRPRGARTARSKGHLWHIRYPIEGEPGRFIVGRDDPAGDDAGRHRRRGASGRRALHATWSASTRSCRWSAARSRSSPTNIADPENGTGAVKITPAHDFNDFEVGQPARPADASTSSTAGARHATRTRRRPIAALDRLRRRASAVVAELEAAGPAREGRSRTRHKVPHGDRGGVPIEPLADRPVVRATPRLLAKPAIEAVETGSTVLRAEAVGEHLLRLDAQHPALVHLAPALVGPPDPGLVRPRRHGLRRETEARGEGRGARRTTARTWR